MWQLVIRTFSKHSLFSGTKTTTNKFTVLFLLFFTLGFYRSKQFLKRVKKFEQRGIKSTSLDHIVAN